MEHGTNFDKGKEITTKPRRMRLYNLFILFILFAMQGLQAQTNVEIEGENLYNDQVKKVTYIVGNVIIKHDGVVIQCDSAIRKQKEGVIEGFGHIFIYQPDTFTLSGGEYLIYEELSKKATVKGKSVILKDDNMTLLTTSLNYDMANQIGYYTEGADILNDQNTLKSKRGYYNRRTNVFNFKDNVKLNGKDYRMEGDTLDYYSSTKTACFFGPSKIISDENTIVCNYGWYNTNTETAQFSRGATIHGKKSSIVADSLLYDKKQGLGRGIHNIKLTDSTENFTVYGQRGWYYQKSSESIVTDKPVALQIKDEDTMLLMSDTFYYKSDSAEKFMRAYGHTSILQKDVQGKCDSMIYNFNDSIISLFKSPILWSDKNQITGDTMFIRLKAGKIDNLRVNGNAFLASEVKPEYYNQISGRKMINNFDSGKLKSVYVEGNASSIYYLRDNETDSAEYTGVNKVSCGRMIIEFDSSKVRGIRFYMQPDGKMYPMNQFPETEKFLTGLDWKPGEKPIKDSFLMRTLRVIPIPVKAPDVKLKGKAKPAKPANRKKKTA